MIASRSRLFDWFGFRRRSSAEQQNTAARPPNTRGGRLWIALCVGAIAIGIIALTGYVLANASIAALGTNGKPVAAVAAFAFIVLGAGLLALLSTAPAGVLTARRAALGVIILAAADLLSAAFWRDIEEWKVWAARGGVDVHPYPIASLLLIALGSALVLITTRRDFAGHVIASAVLSISAVFFFAYFVKVPSFLDQSRLIAPAAAATWGLVLIAAAALLTRPRGWVVPLLSRTSAGRVSRLLLAAAFVVPFLAFELRGLGVRWLAPEADLTVFVALHAFFGVAIVLSVGAILLRRESDLMRLAAIVDSSVDAIIGISSQGLIESWNGGAKQMFGYTAAEAIGRPVAMLTPPELRGETPLLFERVRRGERVDPFETVRVGKDDRRIDVWLSFSPVLDGAGDVAGVSGIVHDISNRKRADEEIRRQSEQYATMLATTSDGFWVADLEGRLLDVNDAYCRMSGYSREELLELRIGDIDATETPEETAGRIRGIVESGFARFETKHRTRDNRILDIEGTVSLWRAAGRMLAFMRDITQQRKEQEALRESEERLQLAQRVAGLGHFSWDMQNNTTTRSDGLLALYGLPSGTLNGRADSWKEQVFPDDVPLVEAEIQKSLTSGDFSCDFRVVRPDASIHWLHERAKVFFSDDGKPLRMVGVSMDITERMRTEETLRKSEAALREAQRSAQVGHWEWSALTGATMWSDEVYRILGIPIGSATPSYELLFGIIDQKSRRRMEEEIARVLGSSGELDGVVDMDLPITTPAGTALVVSQRAYVDRDAAGNVVGFHGTCQDITKRVETEEALRDSEASLAEAQQIAHVGSAIVYPETNEIHASDEYFRIFDLEPRPGTALKAFFDRVHQEDRAAVKAALKAAASSGTFDAEFRIACGDGSVRYAHGIARKRVGNERNPGLLGTIEDVTERKLAEEALRQHSERLERSNLDLERFNRLAVGRELRMIELKQQINDLCSQLGQPAQYVLPGADAPANLDGDVRILNFVANKAGADASLAILVTDVTEARTREAALRRSSEEVRESRFAALNMMEDAVGAARSLERANRDLELQIAETRRSDEANRRLATVVEQAAETIVVTELDGTIVYVNPAFERITGYTSEEVIGQHSRMLKSGKQSADFYQHLWSTIGAGRVWQGHFVNQRKDGSHYEEEATISPVRDASGIIINYVAIKRDVTAEIALEAQLRHAQKIEAIGTLAGGVAHDFNNLLQAMLSIVQLLKRKSPESPRRVEHLDQLDKTIRRGSSLTRQLLLFARRETSKRETLDLNEILGDLVAFLRRVVRANIRLTVEPANVPLRISADRGQIEQVITNLAGNAIDAMPAGGSLSIVAGGDAHTAWLKVCDTGAGISETIRARIFEPFFTTKEAGKGTGLGLSVVHGIVIAHGGSIDVECPAEGGTAFRIELPLQSPAAVPDPVAPSEEELPNGRGERVLVVEDDESAREGLSGILEMLGYTVVAVGSGEEALGIDAAVPFSVVLTDFMLPGMPGIEVVRRLRERSPDLKAILMSGYAPAGLIETAVAANEFRFLQKPFDMAELARTLRAVLLPVAQG